MTLLVAGEHRVDAGKTTIQPDVIQLSHAVSNPVVRAMTQPMDCRGTVRSHVWLYIRYWLGVRASGGVTLGARGVLDWR